MRHARKRVCHLSPHDSIKIELRTVPVEKPGELAAKDGGSLGQFHSLAVVEKPSAWPKCRTLPRKIVTD